MSCRDEDLRNPARAVPSRTATQPAESKGVAAQRTPHTLLRQSDHAEIAATLSLDSDSLLDGFSRSAKAIAQQQLNWVKSRSIFKSWAKTLNPEFWRYAITISQGNGWSVSAEENRRRLNYIRLKLLRAMFGNNYRRKGARIFFLTFKQGSRETYDQHFHTLMAIEGRHDWSDGAIAHKIIEIEQSRPRKRWEKEAHVDWDWKNGNRFHRYVARELKKELTPELAKQLTETGITEDNFFELEMNELEEADEDDSGITSDLEVHVDGQKIANPYEGSSGIEHANNVRSYQFGKPGKYYYVNMTEEKGLWLTLEINGPFDPEKLDISISDNVLPDKETIRLASPSYRGTNNFGYTHVNVQDNFVIYPDGSRREIEFLDV